MGAERRMAAADALERHDPARRSRAGARERSGGRISRRADVRARSAGPPRHSRADARLRDRGAPCSSARTSCRTPKRCAAAWRSSPAAGWSRADGSPRCSPFEVRGWELVVSGLTAAMRSRLQGRRSRASRAIADGRHALELPQSHRARGARRATRRSRRARRVADAFASDARGLLRPAGAGPGAAPPEQGAA